MLAYALAAVVGVVALAVCVRAAVVCVERGWL